MKIKDLINTLHEIAPLEYAENYDNVGLLIGDENNKVTGVLICHDALESVINEAIIKGYNLIICYHPIIFSPLKKITGKNYIEKTIIKSIKYDIAIYALHTSLDNHSAGVSKIFCDKLNLKNTKILIPRVNFICKLVTYTIPENAEKIRIALYNVGAGKIGNYENSSYNSNGFSTYQGNENSHPIIGKKNKLTETNEIKIEVIFEKHLESKVLKALFDSHVYEEVAYEIYDLNNKHQNVGMGMIGELETKLSENEFLLFVKEKMQCGLIKHSKLLNKEIKKVAVLGGSGSFAIENAKLSGADIFLTSDIKYHQYYEAENQLILADIGHFESERYIKNYILDFLNKKFPNFVIILSNENTNPVYYL